jgi:phosphoribosylformylglycinamidine cyclo-ligase
VTQAERYRAAGVDLDAADQAKRRIAESVASTRTELARGALGAFGGMIRVPDGFERPVLVMSTDGVGTKVLVAIRAGRHDSVGEDLVNHSVNDILVHGATPLAFLDYLAVARVSTDTIAALVEGVARGCRQHEMTLVGGETAQLPDLYQAGHYDLAGTTPRVDCTPTDTRWRAESCSTSSVSTSTASFPISV